MLLWPQGKIISGEIDAAAVEAEKLFANLGRDVPSRHDANHAMSTLREFELVGELNGAIVLINHTMHPTTVKDPTSTLEHTVWLVF